MKKNNTITYPGRQPEYNNFFLVFLFAAMFFLSPFFPDIQGTRPKLLFLELGIFSVTFLWLLHSVYSGSLTIRKSNINAAVLAYFIYILVSYSLADNKPIALNEFKRMLLCSGVFVISANIIRTDADRLFILLSWASGASFIAVYGLIQKIGRLWIVEVPRMDRVMATFGNPIFFAAYLVIVIPVITALFFVMKNRFVRLALFVAWCLCLASLFFTQTRAAWIGFVVSIIFFGIINIRNTRARTVFLAVSGICCLLFVALTWHVWLRHQAHPLIWRDTLRMWQSAPLFGVGPGSFYINFPKFASQQLLAIWPQKVRIINDAHNEYVQLLAETGIVGLGIFLWIMTGIAVFAMKTIKKVDGENRIILAGLLSGAGALLIQNFFSVDMRFIVSAVYLFMAVGLIYSFENNLLTVNIRNKKIKYILVLILFLFFGIIGIGPGAKLHVVSLVHYDAGHNKFYVKAADEGTGLLPQLLKQYIAQKTYYEKPDFFDEKVLEPARTIDELEKLLKQFPNEAKVYEKIAWVYAKQKNFPAAIENYKNVLRIDPGSYGSFNNMGNIYFLTSNRKMAIECYKNSIRINPNQPDAHTNLGILYYYEGRLKEAADELNIVLKLDPGNEKAIVTLKRMRE